MDDEARRRITKKQYDQAAEEYLDERSKDWLNPIARAKLMYRGAMLRPDEIDATYKKHGPGADRDIITDARDDRVERGMDFADKVRSGEKKPVSNVWAKVKYSK